MKKWKHKCETGGNIIWNFTGCLCTLERCSVFSLTPTLLIFLFLYPQKISSDGCFFGFSIKVYSSSFKYSKSTFSSNISFIKVGFDFLSFLKSNLTPFKAPIIIVLSLFCGTPKSLAFKISQETV